MACMAIEAACGAHSFPGMKSWLDDLDNGEAFREGEERSRADDGDS